MLLEDGTLLYGFSYLTVSRNVGVRVLACSHLGVCRLQPAKLLQLIHDVPRQTFFYSMLNLRLPIALALMAAAYLISFLTWALIWHGRVLVSSHSLCFAG